MDSPAEALAQSEKDAAVDSSKHVGQGSKPAGQGSKPQLFTWGLGKSGQLGTGQENTEHTPQRIKLPALDGKKRSSAPTQVACGGLCTAVVTEDGDMFATGCGKYGRLATDSEGNHLSFIPVPLPEKVMQVSCGSWHGAAVTVSGGLMVWGHRKGCGIPTAANSATNNKQTSSIVTRPYVLLTANEHRVVGVACGHNFTLAWTQEGRVLSWGSGHHGVLGHGSNDDVASPRLLRALQGENITEASAGYSHSAFVAADGRVYTCGKGKDGALGLGEGSLSDIAKPKLVAFPEKEQVVKVSCSVGEHHGHMLALTSEGRVFSWGDGYKGKLGLGNQDSHYAPTPIPASYFNTERVTVVCAGGIHSTAATAEGSVFTWGCGSDGRLGHPEGQGHRYLFRSDVPKKVEGLEAKSKRALVSCTYYHTAAVIE